MFGFPEQFRRAVFLAVLVGCVAFSGLTHSAGGADRLTESRSYDALNRLTALGVLGGEAAAPVFRSFAYAYNDANQRVAATREDGSRWDYGYDALGHLTAAVRRLPGGELMPGHEFAWTYDALGNRTAGAAGSVATDDSLPDLTATYTPAAQGDRNQYATVATPGFALATGKAHAAAEVTVNGEPAALRRGEFFAHAVPADTEAGPARVSLDIAATEGGETDTVNRIAVVPPQNAAFRYDADGNLVDDGWRQYTWDAEDRLLSVGVRVDRVPPGAPAWRVDYAYDFAGRRVRETALVRLQDAAPDTVGEWIIARERLFLHDGWKVVGEWDGAGRLWQSYLWGLDLSGTPDGAGGVGGLLAVTRHAGPSSSAHFVAQDGGGNVSLLVDAADGALSAAYEYDPFGNLLAMSGPFAEANPYRFSGKRQDAFTGLYDYGFRSYDPVAGRWLSRDPIGESGGFNWYGFVGNDPVNAVDVLGMAGVIPFQDNVNYYGEFILTENDELYFHNTATGWFGKYDGNLPRQINSYTKDIELLDQSIKVGEQLTNFTAGATDFFTLSLSYWLRREIYDPCKDGVDEDSPEYILGGAATIAAGGRGLYDGLRSLPAFFRAVPGALRNLPNLARALPRTIEESLNAVGNWLKSLRAPGTGTRAPFNLFPSKTKGIMAEISGDGIVTFAVEAGAGSPMTGTEMFAQMMKHFGSNVKGVRGSWHYGDNLATVNKLTSEGMSLSEAALQTWTARRAAEHGFTSVRVLGSEGSAGAYKSVSVIFE